MTLHPLELLASHLPSLTKTERIIAEYILKDPFIASQKDAETLAAQTQTSKAAFIRLCQKIGYQGYAEFRYALSFSLQNQAQINTITKEPILKTTLIYSTVIQQMGESLLISDLNQIIMKIKTARRLKIFGSNRTFLSAQQLRLRLSKMGLDAEAIGDEISMREISENLNQDDFCLLFSIDGRETYLSIIEILNRVNCPITLVTMSAQNTLTNQVTNQIILPIVSRLDHQNQFDDQIIYFVFIEMLILSLKDIIETIQ